MLGFCRGQLARRSVGCQQRCEDNERGGMPTLRPLRRRMTGLFSVPAETTVRSAKTNSLSLIPVSGSCNVPIAPIARRFAVPGTRPNNPDASLGSEKTIRSISKPSNPRTRMFDPPSLEALRRGWRNTLHPLILPFLPSPSRKPRHPIVQLAPHRA